MANQHTKGADKQLTEQQLSFVEHFLKFGNGTAAAEQAGYTNPEIQAVRLLSKPHIKNYLKKAVAAKAMSYAPDMIEQLANVAMDTENIAPKDRIAAAIAVLDRAGIDNGRAAPTINVDASNKTVNVTGDAVAKLIAETFNRGQSQLSAPVVMLPSNTEEGEFSAIETNDDDD